MAKSEFDVVVIGSGFGGSLSGLILSRLGFSVCVLDKSVHPRFTIGESSTPLADQILKRIATRYQFDWLTPMTTYGTAQGLSDEVIVGLKRGFSYFRHQPNQDFNPLKNRSNELLVAASQSDQVADTHWLRSTVDYYIAKQLGNSGVSLYEQFDIEEIQPLGDSVSSNWEIRGCAERDSTLSARFLIDASGRAGVLSKFLQNNNSVKKLETKSGAIYGHFRNLKPWTEIYQRLGGDVKPHPFKAHHAALHHCLDEGWMWQLGFDNGVTSCGLVLGQGLEPSDDSVDEVWNTILKKYPSIGHQFARAELVEPLELRSSNRLQYFRPPAGGPNWLCLPSSCGFVDPLHSTGIAHTLHAVEQIGFLFANEGGERALPDKSQVAQYSGEIEQEIIWIDLLVSACYQASFDFPLFVAATMLYFVAVTAAERSSSSAGFLNAKNEELVNCIRRVCRTIGDLRERFDCGDLPKYEIAATIDWIRHQIAPFNRVGLMNPHSMNLYRHTAAPEKSV